MAARNALLTGMSGTGKSVVVGELRSRGMRAIDMDEPGWSFVDPNGHQLWREERIRPELEGNEDGVLFVSGCTENMVAFYPLFHEIVLLSAPRDVIVQRLRDRAGNPYGKKPEELAEVLGYLETVEPLLRRRATREIVTTRPLAEVVAELLSLASEG
jgi:dephospho-CoA kinase